MKNQRGLLLLSLPVVGATLLVVALMLRQKPQERATMPKSKIVANTLAPSAARPTLATPPKPVAPDLATAAANEARLRGSYQNFRTAVATKNKPVQDALAKVLRRDREAAERLAVEDLASARTSADREIAQRTLEALRN